MELPTTPLQTGTRVVLRHLRTSDLRPFQAYRHDPAVGKFQGWSPQSDEESYSFLAQMSQACPFERGSWFQIAIADRATDELIGDIGVFVRPDATSAEIGFTVRTESQGKGLASEAVSLALALLFDRTSINVVEAIIDSRNQPALDLAARIGMGRARVVCTEFRGEPCTEFIHALHRSQTSG